MSDQTWAAIRYALIAVGSFLAGKGYVTMDQVNTVIENLPAIIGGITTLVTAIWGLYVKWNTRAVPAITAARRDVPTINPATGSVEPGPTRA
jgi:hypothetical protein